MNLEYDYFLLSMAKLIHINLFKIPFADNIKF